MLGFIIVKYLHLYFVHFENVGLPYGLQWGTLSATGHSSFLRSAKMVRSTRKHGLTRIYGENHQSNSSHLNETMSGLCKLFSASTGYKRSSSQLRMCVYLSISCEVTSMYRKLSLWH